VKRRVKHRETLWEKLCETSWENSTVFRYAQLFFNRITRFLDSQDFFAKAKTGFTGFFRYKTP
jgi:hypothetical protein